MCVSPVRIPNPNKGLKDFLKHPTALQLSHDCSSQFIEVPCRKCPECLRNRQESWIQRVSLESLMSHLFFCTLTYNSKYLPFIQTSSGKKINCVDWHDLKLFIQRIQDTNLFQRPFSYLAVSERGSEGHRPHFHIIFAIRSYSSDPVYFGFNEVARLYHPLRLLWYRNLGSRKHPIPDPLLTYVERWRNGRLEKPYDFSYIEQTGSLTPSNNCVAYTTKYIQTYEDSYESRLRSALELNYEPSEASHLWTKVRSHMSVSPSFGWSDSGPIYDYLRKCVDYSLDNNLDYPVFIGFDGKLSPMCNYLKNKVLTEQDVTFFYMNSESLYIDTIHFRKDKTFGQLDSLYNKHKFLVQKLNRL